MTTEAATDNLLGLKGSPEQLAAFADGLIDRWRDVLRPFGAVSIGRTGAASRGHEGAIRSLEPSMAEVDRVLAEIAADTGVEIEPGLLARAARDASPLIPELIRLAECAGAQVLEGALRRLEEDYEGDPAGIIYGSPEEARAWRALMGQFDARHFLRVFGDGAGEGALAEEAAGLELPVEAFAKRAADKDWDDLTLPELHEWRKIWIEAAYLVAEFAATRGEAPLVSLMRGDDENVASDVVSDLSDDELLLAAASRVRPRGYAAKDKATARELENLRRRAQRRLDAA